MRNYLFTARRNVPRIIWTAAAVCLLAGCLILSACIGFGEDSTTAAEQSEQDTPTAEDGSADTADSPTGEPTGSADTDAADKTESATESESEAVSEDGTMTDKPTEPPTEKPTDKPTEPPTEKPTEKPTEPPTEKPTEKPTEPPTEQPTEKPTEPDASEDVSEWEGLIIEKVYGTGKKAEKAAIGNGFVQLYNTTAKPMSLYGLALFYRSDGGKPYTRLVFPEDAVIPAQGYYLVRTASPDGYDDSTGVMSIAAYDLEWDILFDHEEIRLVLARSNRIVNADDDIIALTGTVSVFYASETAPVQSVFAVDNLSRNKIAVRTAKTAYSGYHVVNITKADSAKLTQLCTVTSTGKVNDVIRPRISEVTFSHPAGIYDSAVTLRLGAPDGYTIYYTTDGSDPTTSSSRMECRTDIVLSDSSAVAWGPVTKAWTRLHGSARPTVSTMPGGYVIKAYATDGTDSTAVFTNTYFIAPELEAYGVSIVSISIQQEKMIGSNGFYSNYCPTGVITDTRPRGLARMEVFDSTGTRVGNSQVELAVSGNGSSGWAMKSLRVYYKGSLNEEGGLDSDLNYDIFGGRALNSRGEAITSFSRLLLRNSGNDCASSYIRDAYMQRASSVLNVDTMATASTLVFVNGEFWGVYNMRERYSPEYVESHYGVNKDNVAVVESDYSQVHTNTNADFVLSSGEEGDEKPFNDMVAYMRKNSLAVQDNYEYICSLMDIDSFIDMWVARLFFVARDWPENNIKVWRNKNTDDPSGMDTKWHFTLLDMDMGLSFYDFTTENENFFWAFDSNSVCGTIMRALMQNETFKQKFILRYYEVFTEIFTPEYLGNVLEEMITERDALMPLQQARWGNEGASVATWNREVGKMRSFVAKRQAIGLKHMYSYFNVTAADMETLTDKKVTFSFNSVRAAVSCNGETVTTDTRLRFEGDSRTLRIKAAARTGYTLTSIVWTGSDGKTKTVTADTGQGEATFTVTCSGTVSVYAKKNTSGEEDVPTGTLVAGATYLFCLTEDGDLYAWGDNRGGVLGLNSSAATVTKPTLVMKNVAKVATSSGCDFENGSTAWMTAILTRDGKLYTVGANGAGQLGRNGTSDDEKRGLVSFSGKIKDVSVGFDHMLVLDENGVLWGVGNNSYGQIRASGSSSTSFVRVADHVVTMSAGRRSTLYINENACLYGLGDNRWNKMLAGAGDRLTEPTLLRSDAVTVSSGEHECLVVTESGDLYYAGWRDLGSFSQGGGNNPSFRQLMSGVETASVYFGDVAILSESGDVYVYGLNNGGAIGSAVTGGTPRKLNVGDGVIAVAAGHNFTAYLYEDGSVRVKGDNTYGQAGTGKTGGSASLTAVYPQ
jgi:hypothetical protein